MDSDTAESGTEAYNAGGTAAGVVIDTENGEIKREVNTATKAISVTADASISYNSTTHKYTATGKAKAGNTEMDSDTAESGTEAYEAGVTYGNGAVTIGSVSAPQGSSSSFTVTATASNGKTKTEKYYIRHPNSSTIQIRQGNQSTGRIVAELDISDD